MDFTSESLTDGTTLVTLSGRLDLEGTQAIEQKFAFATTARKDNIVVSLADVSFLSSIGIRMLVTSAKSQANRGGKIVLAAPQPLVRKILEMAGIDQLISVAENTEAARSHFSQ